jgi:hypothetical protein
LTSATVMLGMRPTMREVMRSRNAQQTAVNCVSSRY